MSITLEHDPLNETSPSRLIKKIFYIFIFMNFSYKFFFVLIRFNNTCLEVIIYTLEIHFTLLTKFWVLRPRWASNKEWFAVVSLTFQFPEIMLKAFRFLSISEYFLCKFMINSRWTTSRIFECMSRLLTFKTIYNFA